jgi:hypothetical protein
MNNVLLKNGIKHNHRYLANVFSLYGFIKCFIISIQQNAGKILSNFA